MKTRPVVLGVWAIGASIVCAFLSCLGVQSQPARPLPALPLKPAATGRYLVDQNNQPFLVTGDTAWSLIAQLDHAGVDQYLNDRQAKGFNSIIVNLIEHKFSSMPPHNRAGVAPFTSPGDFSTPHDVYFDFAHDVVNRALRKGIVVWLAPAYLGYGGGDEGFFKEIKAGGVEKLRAYGRFLGKRFKDEPNVVWLLGGDYTPTQADQWTVTELAAAIREADDFHPMTVHSAPEQSAVAVYGQARWLTVDIVYSYKPALFEPLLAERALEPARPFVLIETTYEGEHNSKPEQIRRQAYWAILSGACGQFFGNNPIWHFDGPGIFPTMLSWQQALDAAGSADISRLHSLFSSVPWFELNPEGKHAIITAGYGKDTSTALTACTTDGHLAITYFPSTGSEPRTATVDTSQFSGPVRARWFNPVTGRFVNVPSSPWKPGGSRPVQTPGDNGAGANDWVLLLQVD